MVLGTIHIATAESACARVDRAQVRVRVGGAFEWIGLYHLRPRGAAAGRLAVMAAVEAAVEALVVMVETASVVMGGGGQSPAGLRLGWWPVAEAEEMTTSEAASAMAEAAAAMKVAAAVAVVGRRGGQDGVVVRPGTRPATFEPAPARDSG